MFPLAVSEQERLVTTAMNLSQLNSFLFAAHLFDSRCSTAAQSLAPEQAPVARKTPVNSKNPSTGPGVC